MSFEAQLAAGQKHLSEHDARLSQIIAIHGPCTVRPHTDYYATLVRSIISQQLSIRAAETIYNRLLALFDGKLPTPEALLAIDIERLRGIGLSYAKAGYMHDLAQHIIDGRLDLKHIAEMPNEEVIKELIAVKGLGVWSVHMFLIFSLGRLDVLPTGDLGIRKAAQNLYDLPSLPSPAELRKLADEHSWTPYESLAAWYLWRSLEN